MISARWPGTAGLAAVLLLAATASAPAQQAPSAAELMDDLMWSRTPVGGSFDLIDHAGRRRTDAEFRGKFLLLYFGYIHCPDACPTDLAAIASAINRLGPSGDAVQPLFISVDPQRDTVERLADYVRAFHPRLIGLTGAPEEIRRVALAYKVYYAKVPAPEGADYAIDHTSFTYIVGRDGKYLGFFPPGTRAERMVETIRQQLNP
ncbi:MAG TPA: SCO family protein [Burkholderiaceae bacterium]|nr:SCO family protein [Burkholderiaceae bacterium]